MKVDVYWGSIYFCWLGEQKFMIMFYSKKFWRPGLHTSLGGVPLLLSFQICLVSFQSKKFHVRSFTLRNKNRQIRRYLENYILLESHSPEKRAHIEILREPFMFGSRAFKTKISVFGFIRLVIQNVSIFN
jgi:hypothetical protein